MVEERRRVERQNAMTKALPLSGESKTPKRVPFDRVVLVLQGGGALGAYQGGVYQALHEAKIEVSWICGTSIGGINGALIAGNRPERRVERLREFWGAITRPPIWIPDPALFGALSWKGSGPAHLTDRLSAVSSMIYGVPNFFTPRPFPPLIAASERPDLVSCYETAPLRATLERLVDFDLINSKSVRFSVAATNARTGAPVYFDSLQHPITSAHIMAGASLPPSFPPTEIDGEYYWDGAVVSNSPMQYVIDDASRYTALVFQVDLWDANGEIPLDVPSAYSRMLEIHSATRLNITLEQYKKAQKFRLAVAKLLDQLPEAARNDPEMQFLVEEARVRIATLVQLKYQSSRYEPPSKNFEFSRAAMEERWRAGYDDAKIALGEPRVFELPHVTEAARIFDVHHGWAT
jgi:NTE family protein